MNNCLPPTTKKVAMHTCNNVNQEIRAKTVNCINTYKNSSVEVLSDKIEKLNNEWDTERVLETKAAVLVLMSSIMGYKKKKNACFIATGAIGFFLIQHALLGWCPSLPIIRIMGVKTAEEIHNEKTVFKYLRGDFAQDTQDANEMLALEEK